MKVLFDWDDPYLSGKWALKRAIELGLYALSKFLRIRLPFTGNVYAETERYSHTIAKLNSLVGIEVVFGINDNVAQVKPNVKDMLTTYDVDVRRHIHIGKATDPNRERVWIPPLVQLEHTWHYDRDYVNGNPPLLLKEELPVWHIDAPYWLWNYIDFLYDVVKGKKIYDKEAN